MGPSVRPSFIFSGFDMLLSIAWPVLALVFIHFNEALTTVLLFHFSCLSREEAQPRTTAPLQEPPQPPPHLNGTKSKDKVSHILWCNTLSCEVRSMICTILVNLNPNNNHKFLLNIHSSYRHHLQRPLNCFCFKEFIKTF